MKYQKPEVKITQFAAEDVLTQSAGAVDLVNNLGNSEITTQSVSLEDLIKGQVGYQG